MPQSIASLHTHIVFSTKHREPFIHDDIADHLFAYIATVCHRKECQPIKIGGWLDHIHILCALSRKIAVMDLIKTIKTDSNHWFTHHDLGNPNFSWQLGYAALSVTPRDSPKIVKYIADQKEHHSRVSYQDECRELFEEAGLKFDERYFWD